jgi:hypothetical protein
MPKAAPGWGVFASCQHKTSRRLPPQGMRGLRGARGRPRSCCSLKGAARLARPARGIFLEPHVAAYRQWHRRGAESRARLTRRPTRYIAGGRGRDPRGWSVSHGAVIRAYRELCVRDQPFRTAPPRAPHPLSREADGLQLASSWTSDARIVREVSRAGIRSCSVPSAHSRESGNPGKKCMLGHAIRYDEGQWLLDVRVRGHDKTWMAGTSPAMTKHGKPTGSVRWALDTGFRRYDEKFETGGRGFARTDCAQVARSAVARRRGAGIRRG